jgi:hypothetical protein
VSSSRDPIGFESTRLGIYEFLSGNALNRLDASGLYDVGALCRTAVDHFKKTHLPVFDKACPTDSLDIQCVVCTKGNVYGHTTCKKEWNTAKTVSIEICVNQLELLLTEQDVKDELYNTLVHENIHALDYCGCNKGCALSQLILGQKVTDFCRNSWCMEVRAHLVDGSCDNEVGDTNKKACIFKKLKDLYNAPHRGCSDSDLHAAVEHCYFKDGNIPFPIPIPVPDPPKSK